MSSQPGPRFKMVTVPATAERSDIPDEQSVTLRFDGFAWQAIEEESIQLGVSVEDLATFAVLYYLADLDSGRTARRLPAALSSMSSRPGWNRS